MNDRISSWKGIYVEFDPQGGFMLLWDGLGFLGTVTSQGALWEAVKAARKGSPPMTYRHEAKPKTEMSDAERFAMIEAYMKANPNVRVPIRTEVKTGGLPTEAQINAKVMLKKLEKMSQQDRDAILAILKEEGEQDAEISDNEEGQDPGGEHNSDG